MSPHFFFQAGEGFGHLPGANTLLLHQKPLSPGISHFLSLCLPFLKDGDAIKAEYIKDQSVFRYAGEWINEIQAGMAICEIGI